jgi:hypothetical protein
MQNASAPDSYARELTQLQDEIALLSSLLEAITLIGKEHEDKQGRCVVHPPAYRPRPRARRNTGSGSLPRGLDKAE